MYIEVNGYIYNCIPCCSSNGSDTFLRSIMEVEIIIVHHHVHSVVTSFSQFRQYFLEPCCQLEHFPAIPNMLLLFFKLERENDKDLQILCYIFICGIQVLVLRNTLYWDPSEPLLVRLFGQRLVDPQCKQSPYSDAQFF